MPTVWWWRRLGHSEVSHKSYDKSKDVPSVPRELPQVLRWLQVRWTDSSALWLIRCYLISRILILPQTGCNNTHWGTAILSSSACHYKALIIIIHIKWLFSKIDLCNHTIMEDCLQLYTGSICYLSVRRGTCHQGSAGKRNRYVKNYELLTNYGKLRITLCPEAISDPVLAVVIFQLLKQFYRFLWLKLWWWNNLPTFFHGWDHF